MNEHFIFLVCHPMKFLSLLCIPLARLTAVLVTACETFHCVDTIIHYAKFNINQNPLKADPGGHAL